MENLCCFASGEHCAGWEEQDQPQAEPWRSFTVKPPREGEGKQLEEVHQGAPINHPSSSTARIPNTSAAPTPARALGALELDEVRRRRDEFTQSCH